MLNINMQDMPEDVQLLSQPSSEKQDVNQLRLDIPKWKPWLSDQSWEEWADFLDSGVQNLDETSSAAPEWS